MPDRIKIEAIADELAESAGLSKRMARAYTKFIFQSVTSHLVDGDSVIIPAFGKFDMQVSAPRTGRDFDAGRTKLIPAKHRIRFEMSRTLRDNINGAMKESPEEYDEA